MTLGSHQRAVGKSQVHLTPRWLLEPLGHFDIDPCAATERPWDIADRNIVEAEDGLSQPWRGRAFVNPPFDSRLAGKWVRRLADHGRGTLLIHARTETKWFRPIWAHARAILFLYKRVHFCLPSGEEQPNCSGAPVVLAAFGRDDAIVLENCGLEGAFVTGWRRPVALRAAA